MNLFIYLASPGFLAGMPVIMSQLLPSREGQTTTPGTPCPTLYEECVGPTVIFTIRVVFIVLIREDLKV